MGISQLCRNKREEPSRENSVCKSPKAGGAGVVEEVPGRGISHRVPDLR